MRLAISEVQAALLDPEAFRVKLLSEEEVKRGATFIGCLTDALLRYHRLNGDMEATLEYLNGRLEKLEDEARKDETRAQVNWYDAEWRERMAHGWNAIKQRINVKIPRPLWVREDFRCSARIGRIDLDPEGGYTGWTMISANGESRLDSIEVPLLQYALADHLDVPAEEVRIGVYSFKEEFVGIRSCDGPEVETALAAYHALLRALHVSIE